MNLNLQDILALTCVAAAALYLGRMAYFAIWGNRSLGSCGGCSKCPASSEPDEGQLVEIRLRQRTE